MKTSRRSSGVSSSCSALDTSPLSSPLMMSARGKDSMFRIWALFGSLDGAAAALAAPVCGELEKKDSIR